MFAKDRDLLVLEPRLLKEVAWMGQRVHSVPSVVVASGGSDVTDSSGPFGTVVDVGAVALLDGLAVEIVSVASATQASISLIRSDRDGPALAASSLGASAAMDVYTFGPQIGLVHRQVLRGLGLEAGVTEVGGDPGEDRVTNPGAVAELEALGALHLVYAAAVPMVSEPMTSTIMEKAARYRERFRSARLGIGAELDLNGDGVPDATRRVGAFQMVRR